MSGLNAQNADSEHRWLPLTGQPTKPTTLAMRPALAQLPALPLNRRPQPATMKTSPADIRITSTRHPLTPPSTPRKPEIHRASVSSDGIEHVSSASIDLGAKPTEAFGFLVMQEPKRQVDWKAVVPKPYTNEYELQGELGHGVWSTVYYANESPEPTNFSESLPPTPPMSPTNGAMANLKTVLAVKKPCRRDAHKPLEKEAKILTYLHSYSEGPSYLVPFHGFDAVRHSIVLDAVPLTLERHAKSAVSRPLSTRTMFDPVIGPEEWSSLAAGLIGGLAFLHEKGCVHGDIKPANILLRPIRNGEFIPLYCDFSSSHIISGTSNEELGEVNAVTMDYLSPELFESLRNDSNDRAIANFSSDVFALGVTLLFAAIGESPYASARMDILKTGMAKQGTPVEFARCGEQATRVMKGRAVEKAIKAALAKDPAERLPAKQWADEMSIVVEAWKDGGWSRGG